MIKACSLSSGSNGNAFFIETGGDAYLVDAGISCKQILLRLKQIGSHIDDIKGIFITHEHSDHIRGLTVLLKKHQVPIYITEKTYHKASIPINQENLRFIEADGSITLNQTVVQSMRKSHDAVEPALFRFSYKEKNISVITDAGYGCDNVIEGIRSSDILFLESNYDEKMLWSGFYPDFLKRRVASNYGHLSNDTAANLVLQYASPKLTHLFLSHLSENNNTPNLATEAFKETITRRRDLEKINTLLTSRHGVSDVITI